MDHIIVFIIYGGRWDANSKYVDHQVKIIMVQEGISYTSLIWKIYKELGLDPTINSIKMSFDPKIETSRGMTIENDENVAVFLYLIKNDPEFKRCPLVVEIEEYSQSTTKSKTTNNQASPNEKEKDISVVSEESGMCGKSTSCSSMGGTANTMTSSATPFFRINSDSSKANQFSFGCQPPVFGFKSNVSPTTSLSSGSTSAASANSSSPGIIAEGNGIDKSSRRFIKVKSKQRKK